MNNDKTGLFAIILIVALLVIAGAGAVIFMSRTTTEDTTEYAVDASYYLQEGTKVTGAELTETMIKLRNQPIAFEVTTLAKQISYYNYDGEKPIDFYLTGTSTNDPSFINPNGLFQITIKKEAYQTVCAVQTK